MCESKNFPDRPVMTLMKSVFESVIDMVITLCLTMIVIYPILWVLSKIF